MLFYLVMGGMFALYAADLLFLTAVSFIARSAEVAELLKKWVWGWKCGGGARGKRACT